MFLDEDCFIYKDLVLSCADRFLREYENLADFIKYPGDIHNNMWDVSHFLYKGEWDENHKCRESLKILRNLEYLFIASYSVLRSGAVIYPHSGYNLKKPVFRVHLPLIIPEGDCWLKVGKETRTWEMGKLLIFDDTVEHEAQNNTTEDRVILLMDFTMNAFQAGLKDLAPWHDLYRN